MNPKPLTLQPVRALWMNPSYALFNTTYRGDRDQINRDQ